MEESAGLPDNFDSRRTADLASQVLARFNRRVRTSNSGLGIGSMSALSTIDRLGPLRVGDLARLERVAAPTMTRMVSALVDRGLVDRVADPLDGRAQILSITEDGRAVMQHARIERADLIEELLTTLRPQQLEELGALFAELLDSGVLD